MNGIWKKKLIAMAAALVMCSTTMTSIGVSANDLSAEDVVTSVLTNAGKKLLEEIPVVGEMLSDIFEDVAGTLSEDDSLEKYLENNFNDLKDEIKDSLGEVLGAIKEGKDYSDLKDYNKDFIELLTALESKGAIEDGKISYSKKNYSNAYDNFDEFDNNVYNLFSSFGKLVTGEYNLSSDIKNVVELYSEYLKDKCYLNSETWELREKFINQIKSVYMYGYCLLSEDLVCKYKAAEKSGKSFKNNFKNRMTELLDNYFKAREIFDKELIRIDLEKKADVLYNYKTNEYYNRCLKPVEALKTYDDSIFNVNIDKISDSHWSIFAGGSYRELNDDIRKNFNDKDDKDIKKGYENSISYSYGEKNLNNLINYSKSDLKNYINNSFYINGNLDDYTGIYINGIFNIDSNMIFAEWDSPEFIRQVQYYDFNGNRKTIKRIRNLDDECSIIIDDKTQNGNLYKNLCNSKFLVIEKASDEAIANYKESFDILNDADINVNWKNQKIDAKGLVQNDSVDTLSSVQFIKTSEIDNIRVNDGYEYCFASYDKANKTAYKSISKWTSDVTTKFTSPYIRIMIRRKDTKNITSNENTGLKIFTAPSAELNINLSNLRLDSDGLVYSSKDDTEDKKASKSLSSAQFIKASEISEIHIKDGYSYRLAGYTGANKNNFVKNSITSWTSTNTKEFNSNYVRIEVKRNDGKDISVNEDTGLAIYKKEESASKLNLDLSNLRLDSDGLVYSSKDDTKDKKSSKSLSSVQFIKASEISEIHIKDGYSYRLAGYTGANKTSFVKNSITSWTSTNTKKFNSNYVRIEIKRNDGKDISVNEDTGLVIYKK